MVIFFFQAEDGIRAATVTGVQTCALPIYWRAAHLPHASHARGAPRRARGQIGRASCRERVYIPGVAAPLEKNRLSDPHTSALILSRSYQRPPAPYSPRAYTARTHHSPLRC